MKNSKKLQSNQVPRILVGLGTLGLAVFVGAAGSCQSSAADAPKTGPVPAERVVVLERATHAPLSRVHRYSGVVRAEHRADLTFTLSGRLATRPARVGARVKKGDVLAVLDRRPLRNALAAARAERSTLTARLAQAERDTRRAARLREANAIGAEELEKTTAGAETLRAQLSAANANVAEASRLLGEATLRAPFDASVTAAFVEPGEFAQAGRPAIRLAGERSAEVEIEVPESLRGQIAAGDRAEVHFPLSDVSVVTATVDRVGRAAAGAGSLLPVVVTLPADVPVAAGQTAEVRLSTTRDATLTVPVAAVVDPSGSRPALFRVEDDVASLVPVRLGAVVGDRVVVTRGIRAGDRVVVAGHANLVSGERVEVAGGGVVGGNDDR